MTQTVAAPTSASMEEGLPFMPPLPVHEPFLVDLEGFDGPVDLLLDLARKQKVDLAQISVLKLADQYISYIEHAKELRLEVAADYLVMAAWLTYLKSRLLLPDQPTEEGDLTPQDMADILAFQLRRLESIRHVGQLLINRPTLQREFFKSADKGESFLKTQLTFDLKFHDLINAYGRIVAEREAAFYQPKQRKLFKMEDAIERLATMIGLAKEWISIESFMPLQELADYLMQRSAVSSTFGAFLELAKQGQVFLRQEKNFAPIFMRARNPGDEEEKP
jgi:segregation and condensation protein A